MHDLASATAAINEIIEQGEGARGDWRPAHYGRFLAIWEEYAKLTEADPAFEPAFPVIPAFTRQPLRHSRAAAAADRPADPRDR